MIAVTENHAPALSVIYSMKKTLVLGASPNPDRYAHRAVISLTRHRNPVVAVGRRAGNIGGVPIELGKPHHDGVDTVTLYLRAEFQREYYDYIFSLQPKRIIFNPGTENPELEALALERGVEPVEGCTLVMLATGLY